jgi:hypothetical protein
MYDCVPLTLMSNVLLYLQEAASRVAALCDGAAEGTFCGALYSRRAVVDTQGPADDTESAAALWQQSCKDAGIQQYLPQQQQQ